MGTIRKWTYWGPGEAKGRSKPAWNRQGRWRQSGSNNSGSNNEQSQDGMSSVQTGQMLRQNAF